MIFVSRLETIEQLGNGTGESETLSRLRKTIALDFNAGRRKRRAAIFAENAPARRVMVRSGQTHSRRKDAEDIVAEVSEGLSAKADRALTIRANTSTKALHSLRNAAQVAEAVYILDFILTDLQSNCCCILCSTVTTSNDFRLSHVFSEPSIFA